MAWTSAGTGGSGGSGGNARMVKRWFKCCGNGGSHGVDDECTGTEGGNGGGSDLQVQMEILETLVLVEIQWKC